MNNEATLKRLSKAKTALILQHPFVGSVALNMPMLLDESIPTAATNGKYIKFNPEFVDGLTDEQIVFLIAHECFHPMLEHNYRASSRDRKRWNKAGDYVINQLLTDEGIGRFIDGGLLDKNIYNAGGGTTDGIYAILPEDTGEGEGEGEGGIGGTGDDLEPSEGSPAEQEQEASEWRVKVAQAAQAAKMMGKLSAGMERFVGDILQPKVDWREVMQNFVEKCRDDQRSFARPNRRFLPQGMYLPSASGESLPEVAFFVDCSGSIGQAEIDQFAAEIRTVHSDSSPSKLHVIYFDSRVSHHDVFERDDYVDVRPHGGGGTAFSPLWEFTDAESIEPVCGVVLTDLCCHDFGDAPPYPVLWVSNYADTAPFGEVVMIK